MNVKSLITLFAFAGFAASCSNSDFEESGTRPTDGRAEIQIAFSGTGESQEYTRAIASESENKIEQLHIYLFAAAAQTGPFYYLETWTEGADYNPATPAATNFKIQDAGTSKKGILYPNELKGLPWIKLLCVANNGGTPKFYDEEGTEILGTLTKVATDAAGTVTTPGTTEAEFKAAFTMNDADATLIETPLLMTGEGITKISGVSKVDISLKRVMTRFDIVNDKAKTNLTIEDIYMVQGRKSAPLWGATPTTVEPADLPTSDLLAKYANVDFDQIPGANTGETASAFYVYPNLATDQSYLVIKGTYKSPATGKQEPVEYHVDVARTPDGAPKAEFIKLLANNRYKLRISDVTSSNIMGTFEVVDWTSGGGIIVKPSNDSPVFVAAEAFSGANTPTELTALNTDASPYNYEVTGDDGTGSFTIEIGATGKVRAEKSAVQTTTRAEADGEVITSQSWLVISEPAFEERDGVWYTKFDISYTDAVGVSPVAVHFINAAASYDPALWTTVNFYGQKSVPVFAAAATGTGSNGNTIDVTDGKAPTATIHTLLNSYVLFDVTCVEGVTVDATSATGYKAEEIAVNGFVHTYKVSVSDASTATGGTIVFKNTGDAGKTTTLTLTAAAPEMTFEKSTDDNNAATWDEGNKTLKIDLGTLANGTCTFKINAPAGVTIASLACPWLTITESKAWDNTEKFATYTIAKTSSIIGTGDVTLSFVNGLTQADKNISAPGLDVKLHKEASKPKFGAGATTDSWSTFNKGLDSNFTNPAAATITMYKVADSQITVNMTCDEAAEFDAVTGLEVKRIESTNEYTIKVANVSELTASTTTVTAKNSSATECTAALTITWKDPAITVALTDDASGNVTSREEGGNIVYTVNVDAISTTPFIFTVTAPGGASVGFETAIADAFLTKDDTNAGGNTVTAGTPSAYTLKLNDSSSATDDIELVFTNTVTGGGNKTVILRSSKKSAP
ncbi:hypothetical protein [Bacteroides timonensis]|uniref:hypothetical protein n=1 Tax=Bacteroides timonensis TaxID=1470345 RepID=UPI0004B42F21|nr:hypothetical protein [Bacteroides timonensis]